MRERTRLSKEAALFQNPFFYVGVKKVVLIDRQKSFSWDETKTVSQLYLFFLCS